MMFPVRGLLISLLFAEQAAAQVEPRVESTLERLAAKAALERATQPRSSAMRVGVAREIVHAHEAPGARDSTWRSEERMTLLARDLNARVVSRERAFDCTNRRCVLRNLDVFVSLSEPSVHNDTASVTVTTVVQRKQRRAQYQTVNVIFARRAGTWRVIGFEDLGVS